MSSECVAPVGDLHQWRCHARLQRHFQQFHSSPKQARVLERYRRRAKFLQPSLLSRYTVHVAAWVALLPKTAKILPECVRLLSYLLRLHGHDFLTTWLHGTLHLVALRIEECLRENSSSRRHWLLLKRRMPQVVRRDVQMAHICTFANSFREGRAAEQPQNKPMRSASLHMEGNIPNMMPQSSSESDEKSNKSPTCDAFSRAGYSMGLVTCEDVQQVMTAGDTKRSVDRELRKLVMGRQKFANESSAQQADRLRHIEASALVAIDSWDPVAACLLFRKAIACLSPPRVTSLLVSVSRSHSQAVSFEGMALQMRLRDVLSKLVDILDLADGDTRQAMWCSCSIVFELISDFEAQGTSILHAQSAAQWLKLKDVVEQVLNQRSGGFCPGAGCGYSGLTAGPKVARRTFKDVDRSHVTDNVYEPGTRIKAFQYVFHRPEDPKSLQCPRCQHVITSSYYVVHPKTRKEAILVPFHGHSTCTRQAGARVPYRVIDGFPHKLDVPSNIDYCVHGKLRPVCAPCGGSNICTHGKPRWHCKICRTTIKHRSKVACKKHQKVAAEFKLL